MRFACVLVSDGVCSCHTLPDWSVFVFWYLVWGVFCVVIFVIIIKCLTLSVSLSCVYPPGQAWHASLLLNRSCVVRRVPSKTSNYFVFVRGFATLRYISSSYGFFFFLAVVWCTYSCTFTVESFANTLVFNCYVSFRFIFFLFITLCLACSFVLCMLPRNVTYSAASRLCTRHTSACLWERRRSGQIARM